MLRARAASPASSSSARSGLSPGSASQTPSRFVRTIVSRLLKSCATPPASAPTASIFCDVPQLLLQLPPRALAVGARGRVLRRHDAHATAAEDGVVRDDDDFEQAAVARAVPHRASRRRPVAMVAHERLHARDVLRRPDLADAHREELLARPPIVLHRRVVHGEEAQRLGVEHPHRDRRALEQQLIAQPALAQRVVGRLQLHRLVLQLRRLQLELRRLLAQLLVRELHGERLILHLLAARRELAGLLAQARIGPLEVRGLRARVGEQPGQREVHEDGRQRREHEPPSSTAIA